MPNDFSLQDAAGLVAPSQPQGQLDVSNPSTLASILGFMPVQGEIPQSPPSAPPDTGTPGYNAPVTDPSQDFGLPAGGASSTNSVPGAPSKSIGVGAKVGVSGYNPAANAAIIKGPHSAADKQMAADRADVASQFTGIKAAEAEASKTGLDAAVAAGRIESQKLQVASEAKMKIAAANQDFAAKEQAAMQNAQAESATNIANYRASLMDYSASQVNPSQLWDNAGTAGQFGIVATAFMHDFLAAKGIQTTGLESINKAIQHNISGQLDNMRKKLDVAQGFKELWTMQRSQSATDAEARQRMNGFYLSALSNQIEGTLGQYDSQLALVKAQTAKAAIQQEMVKNDLLVQKHIDDASQQRATNRVHMYTAELSASSAKYTADAHIKAAEIAASAKNQVSPFAGVIFDTSKSGGNMAARRLLPDIKDEKGEIRNQASKVFNTVGNIEHLVDLQDQIAHVPPDIGIEALKRMQSEERRVAELVRNVTKMGIIYDNSGKQINEQEVKLYDEIVSKKDWFLNGDNLRTLGTLAKMILDKENAVLGGISTQILPGDPAYGATSGTQPMDQGNSALTDIQSGPGAGRHVNDAAEDAIKAITAPHASENAYDTAKDVTKANDPLHSANALLNPWHTKQDPYTGAGLSNEEWIDRNLYTQFLKANPEVAKVVGNEPDPSKSFTGVVKLSELAKQGDQRAREALLEFANQPPKGDSMVSYYAQWELAQLGGAAKAAGASQESK